MYDIVSLERHLHKYFEDELNIKKQINVYNDDKLTSDVPYSFYGMLLNSPITSFSFWSSSESDSAIA